MSTFGKASVGITGSRLYAECVGNRRLACDRMEKRSFQSSCAIDYDYTA